MRNFNFLRLMFLICFCSGACTQLKANQPSDFVIMEYNDGSIGIVEYIGKVKNVVIPSTINGKKVISIGNRAFACKQLTDVIIPNSIIQIGDRAFEFNHLNSVIIPDSVTSIGERVFAYNQIKNVNIPKSLGSISLMDLTGGKSYTLADISKYLHKEINDEIIITYYISDKLKSIHSLPADIEDLLKEYVAFSQGKIKLNIVDPANENIVDYIEQLGIIPQQIQTKENAHTSVVTVYTGIGIEYNNETKVLPVVFSLKTIEYDLTTSIRSLIQNKSRIIGILLGDSQRWDNEYSLLQTACINAGYEIKLVSLGQKIENELSALLILEGAETLDEISLYIIDNYIQNGGRVLFTVKAVGINTGGDLSGRTLNDRGLLDMLSSYGVTVLPEIVMDRSALVMQYQTRSQSGALQYRIARYPQWIRILGENGNPSHPVSANFSGLDLYWATPLELHAPAGVTAETLFTTTKDAWSMYEPFYTNPDVPYLFERDINSTKSSKILGTCLSGFFPSWFLNKPKSFLDSRIELKDMPSETKFSRIVVIGETLFATKVLSVTGGTANLDFIVKALEWLSNDDDIIKIPTRN